MTDDALERAHAEIERLTALLDAALDNCSMFNEAASRYRRRAEQAEEALKVALLQRDAAWKRLDERIKRGE